MQKFFTTQIREKKTYYALENRWLLPEEQKGCRKETSEKMASYILINTSKRGKGKEENCTFGVDRLKNAIWHDPQNSLFKHTLTLFYLEADDFYCLLQASK